MQWQSAVIREEKGKREREKEKKQEKTGRMKGGREKQPAFIHTEKRIDAFVSKRMKRKRASHKV